MRKTNKQRKKTLHWMVWDEDDDVPLHAPLILRDCQTGGGGKDYPGDKRKEDREEGRQETSIIQGGRHCEGGCPTITRNSKKFIIKRRGKH